MQNIIDDSSSSDAEVEVYAGISFDAFDDDGNAIELVEGATLDVELTFDSARTEFDLGFITEDGELVALGADCIDNGDATYTCSGDGPGFGVYIVYSYDPSDVVEGCTDESACNYNADAQADDGSCVYDDGIVDCDGNCYNDADEDDICDENDDCIGSFDCAGTCNGSASEDCAGDCNGDATEDECGTCDNDPDNDCVEDCAGEWGGDSVEDLSLIHI